VDVGDGVGVAVGVALGLDVAVGLDAALGGTVPTEPPQEARMNATNNSVVMTLWLTSLRTDGGY
jgi:hypothetical protein